jgi:DNA-binding transcriptional ArsR family regulator
MIINMAIHLNPQLETLLLLMGDDWDEKQMKEVVSELDALGVDGQEFCKCHFRAIEQYYTTFQKHMVISPGTKLLEGAKDESLICAYAYIFWLHPEWIETISGIPDKEIRAELDRLLEEADLPAAKDPEDIIAAIETLGLTAESKWEFMLLTQKPKQQLELIAAAVRENLPAFEKAQAKVSSELAVLLAAAEENIADPNKMRLLQIVHKVFPDAPIVPTLALPTCLMVLEDVTFYGLLTDKLVAGGTEFTKEELLIGAKALSEKSKMEILLALKDTLLFNLEIAEKVGLTAATVSHHMNVLLAAGFVELEKRDGKVYYQLDPKGIQRFLAGVSQLLL